MSAGNETVVVVPSDGDTSLGHDDGANGHIDEPATGPKPSVRSDMRRRCLVDDREDTNLITTISPARHSLTSRTKKSALG